MSEEAGAGAVTLHQLPSILDQFSLFFCSDK